MYIVHHPNASAALRAELKAEGACACPGACSRAAWQTIRRREASSELEAERADARQGVRQVECGRIGNQRGSCAGELRLRTPPSTSLGQSTSPYVQQIAGEAIDEFVPAGRDDLLPYARPLPDRGSLAEINWNGCGYWAAADRQDRRPAVWLGCYWGARRGLRGARDCSRGAVREAGTRSHHQEIDGMSSGSVLSSVGRSENDEERAAGSSGVV